MLPFPSHSRASSAPTTGRTLLRRPATHGQVWGSPEGAVRDAEVTTRRRDADRDGGSRLSGPAHPGPRSPTYLTSSLGSLRSGPLPLEPGRGVGHQRSGDTARRTPPGPLLSSTHPTRGPHRGVGTVFTTLSLRYRTGSDGPLFGPLVLGVYGFGVRDPRWVPRRSLRLRGLCGRSGGGPVVPTVRFKGDGGRPHAEKTRVVSPFTLTPISPARPPRTSPTDPSDLKGWYDEVLRTFSGRKGPYRK